MAAPQAGHFSSVVTSSSFTGSIAPSSVRRKFMVFRHSGYPEQARNSPMRPHLMTMGLPHFSHRCSVASSWRFTSRMVTSALARSSLKPT